MNIIASKFIYCGRCGNWHFETHACPDKASRKSEPFKDRDWGPLTPEEQAVLTEIERKFTARYSEMNRELGQAFDREAAAAMLELRNKKKERDDG